jgi:hypothetical protein
MLYNVLSNPVFSISVQLIPVSPLGRSHFLCWFSEIKRIILDFPEQLDHPIHEFIHTPDRPDLIILKFQILSRFHTVLPAGQSIPQKFAGHIKGQYSWKPGHGYSRVISAPHKIKGYENLTYFNMLIHKYLDLLSHLNRVYEDDMQLNLLYEYPASGRPSMNISQLICQHDHLSLIPTG